MKAQTSANASADLSRSFEALAITSPFDSTQKDFGLTKAKNELKKLLKESLDDIPRDIAKEGSKEILAIIDIPWKDKILAVNDLYSELGDLQTIDTVRTLIDDIYQTEITDYIINNLATNKDMISKEENIDTIIYNSDSEYNSSAVNLTKYLYTAKLVDDISTTGTAANQTTTHKNLKKYLKAVLTRNKEDCSSPYSNESCLDVIKWVNANSGRNFNEDQMGRFPVPRVNWIELVFESLIMHAAEMKEGSTDNKAKIKEQICILAGNSELEDAQGNKIETNCDINYGEGIKELVPLIQYYSMAIFHGDDEELHKKETTKYLKQFGHILSLLGAFQACDALDDGMSDYLNSTISCDLPSGSTTSVLASLDDLYKHLGNTERLIYSTEGIDLNASITKTVYVDNLVNEIRAVLSLDSRSGNVAATITSPSGKIYPLLRAVGEVRFVTSFIPAEQGTWILQVSNIGKTKIKVKSEIRIHSDISQQYTMDATRVAPGNCINGSAQVIDTANNTNLQSVERTLIPLNDMPQNCNLDVVMTDGVELGVSDFQICAPIGCNADSIPTALLLKTKLGVENDNAIRVDPLYFTVSKTPGSGNIFVSKVGSTNKLKIELPMGSLNTPREIWRNVCGNPDSALMIAVIDAIDGIYIDSDINPDQCYEYKVVSSDPNFPLTAETKSKTIGLPDTIAPIVTAPTDISIDATGFTTPIASLGVATAFDNVDGALTPTPDKTEPFSVGTHIITWSATDSAGNTGQVQQLVTVNNIAPTIDTVSVDQSLITVNNEITLTGAFHDIDTPVSASSHDIKVEWGDSSTSYSTSGDVTISAKADGSGTITSAYAYKTAGIYTITVTVTDSGNLSDSKIYSTVVVYDPDAGFVTGEGNFNSPIGAYLPSPSVSGKAKFEFKVKYKKHSKKPKGKLEFELKKEDLEFSSKDFDWLVISDATATITGHGRLNDTSGYGFMLKAIDGQLNNTGLDKLSLKIWDESSDEVIYNGSMILPYTSRDDHEEDESDEEIGKSIIIHKKHSHRKH